MNTLFLLYTDHKILKLFFFCTFLLVIRYFPCSKVCRYLNIYRILIFLPYKFRFVYVFLFYFHLFPHKSLCFCYFKIMYYLLLLFSFCFFFILSFSVSLYHSPIPSSFFFLYTSFPFLPFYFSFFCLSSPCIRITISFLISNYFQILISLMIHKSMNDS